MDKTRAKFEPKYREASQKLGELQFQKQNLSDQQKIIDSQIEQLINSLRGLETAYPVAQELEKELIASVLNSPKASATEEFKAKAE